MVRIVLLSGTDLSTHALTPGVELMRIRSLSGLGRNRFPRIQSVALPLTDFTTTLPLKAFRGVRAISQFD